MVHLVVLCKLENHVTQERLEEMARQARTQLLRIPEVLAVRSGKRIESENPYPYFYSVDVESLDKLAMYRDDPNQVKFVEDVIRPNTREQLEMVYELEPNKDVKYS